jgi:hypothetical protein
MLILNTTQERPGIDWIPIFNHSLPERTSVSRRSKLSIAESERYIGTT